MINKLFTAWQWDSERNINCTLHSCTQEEKFQPVVGESKTFTRHKYFIPAIILTWCFKHAFLMKTAIIWAVVKVQLHLLKNREVSQAKSSPANRNMHNWEFRVSVKKVPHTVLYLFLCYWQKTMATHFHYIYQGHILTFGTWWVLIRDLFHH